MLSSLPRPASYPATGCSWHPTTRSPPARRHRRGTLHWAPRHDPGLARRSAQILAWLADARPALVVVDVSVEVALLVRLAGVPVVVAAMRGDRSDRPHATAYDLADVLLAPWPEESPESVAAATGWTRRSTRRRSSRFDGWRRPAPGPTAAAHGRCCCGARAAAGRDQAELARMRAATPDWEWSARPPGRRLGREEVWRALCGADVVVTHGGQNAVAEVAAARRPGRGRRRRRARPRSSTTPSGAVRDAGLAVGVDALAGPARLAAPARGGGAARRRRAGAAGRTATGRPRGAVLDVLASRRAAWPGTRCSAHEQDRRRHHRRTAGTSTSRRQHASLARRRRPARPRRGRRDGRPAAWPTWSRRDRSPGGRRVVDVPATRPAAGPGPQPRRVRARARRAGRRAGGASSTSTAWPGPAAGGYRDGWRRTGPARGCSAAR